MKSNDGAVSVSAGSHPIVLLWDAFAITLFIVLMVRTADLDTSGVPSRWRRVIAFAIDFWTSLLALSGVFAMEPLWLETARTGQFKWYFARNYAVATDGMLVFPSIFIFMAFMFLYFAFPLTRGRQTVGCFIMRIKVAPPFGDEGSFTFREALKRTAYEFFGLCGTGTWKWDQDGQGRNWYDRKSGCTVVFAEDK